MKFDKELESDLIEKYEKLTDEDFNTLKSKYDESFKKYWTHGNNHPKFGIISMNEFKKRLRNSGSEFFKKYGEV